MDTSNPDTWQYDGPFNMPAKGGPADQYAYGVTMVPSGAQQPALPSDNLIVGVLSQTWERAERRVVSLGFPGGGIDPVSTFPPSARTAVEDLGDSIYCGMTDSSNANINAAGASGLYMACVLEFGIGSAGTKVYFDWTAGSFNLPPCTFVRVSAVLWGTGWNAVFAAFGAVYPLVASVGPGELQGAPPPTASAFVEFDAAETITVRVPSNARAFDVFAVYDPDHAGGTPVFTVTGDVTATRDYASLSMFPPYSPLPCKSGELISVSADIAARACFQFYIAL